MLRVSLWYILRHSKSLFLSNTSYLLILQRDWPAAKFHSNIMHQYKVHLPQRNTWDHEDNMLDSFFMSGINRDKARRDEEEENILDENLDLDKI